MVILLGHSPTMFCICRPDLVDSAFMEPTTPILEVCGLAKTYRSRRQEVPALADFNLRVGAGEIVGLLGPNGAGKTTSVKMIMGLMHPSAGEILYRGRRLEVADLRRGIGFLPENFRPNPNLTVAEYLRLHCELTGAQTAGPEQVGELLAQVGMAPYAERRISDLSKGMGQRVGLAQAFAGDPDFLILDEPTSGLDPIGKSEVIDFLLRAKARGKTIFFCSHILSEVEKVCDRIGILVRGELRYLGPVAEFLQKWQVADLEEAFKKEVQCVPS